MISEHPDPSRIPGLRELWKRSFGDGDPFLDDFFRTGFSPDRCRCLVCDGTVAAALYWFDCRYEGRTYAYLYAVATHPDYRRRGFIRSLMEDTHRELKDRGYAGAMLVPADEGLRQMYAAMGYGDCTTVSRFSAEAGSASLALRPVDRAEYGTLRRALLPEGGLIQEGANLDFLETQNQLYAGDGFLLCCVRPEPDRLLGLEFLGDPAGAPRILHTLGCSTGSFLTFGTEEPYAMLCPLTGDCPRPAYLGLAFD